MDDKSFRTFAVLLLSVIAGCCALGVGLLVWYLPMMAKFEYHTLKELQGVPREVYEHRTPY